MERIVFKNHIVNLVFGLVLIAFAIVAYFLGWIADFLPIVVGIILILLSIKRFLFSFKKITSKNATLILIIELVLDFVFCGLLIYLRDYVELFIGLVIYVRGVAYLIINYVATRKIKLTQYFLNILFVTLGCFLMFSGIDSVSFLSIGVAALILIIGIIYLQAGINALIDKQNKRKKVGKEAIVATQTEEKQKVEIEKSEKKIEKLEKKIDEVKKENKEILEEKKAAINYQEKTVAELKEMAKKKGLTGISQLTKPELIAKIKEAK